MTESMHIKPAARLRGEVTPPGDKSIWHRALMIGAISEGVTIIRGKEYGEDVSSTMRCLKQLGVTIEVGAESISVHGVGLRGFSEPEGRLDAGNSGTTMRLLAGILSAQDFGCVLDGDSSLRKRPMARITEPLTAMGAQISLFEGGYPPIVIEPAEALRSLDYSSPVASAQVKSALLLAGVCSGVSVSITEPFTSRDHTERMLSHFGGNITIDALTVSVSPVGRLSAKRVTVPGDISSAAFFIAAAMMTPGSDVVIKNVGLNPTRTGFLSIAQRMGADIRITERVSLPEPTGDLRVIHTTLNGSVVRADEIPSTIDELPLIGLIAATANGTTTVSGASELRLKESDRISALVNGMRAVGLEIEEREDGFSVEGEQEIRGGVIEPSADHRIVMGFAAAGIASREGITVCDTAAASVSYPGFFTALEGTVER